jgi:tol-pal system protein YbgF
MKRVRRQKICVVLVLFGFSMGVSSAAERRSTSGPEPAGSTRQTLVDLMLQLETLQTELRQLRGTVEVQTHEMERLRRRQKDLLADQDRRLRELERRGGVSSSMPSAPVVAPPPAAGALPGGILAPVTPPETSVPAAAGVPSSAQEQQEYDAAFKLLKQGYYERAAKSFREFIARHPQSSLADNAQYLVSEASYVVRNFRLAMEEYTKVVNDYPVSPKVPEALLKIGYCHYELGDWDRARTTLSQVIARYPNTTVAKSAEIRLAKMKKEGR